MHSSDCPPPPPPPPPATGPALLVQLGRLIMRARSRSPPRPARARAPPPLHERLLHAKLLAAKALVPSAQPSTSQQVNNSQPQPDADETKPLIEAQLSDHVHALWNEQIPICIDVLLAPDCQKCYAQAAKVEEEASYERSPGPDSRCLLLERWTMSVFVKKNHETPSLISSQWLLNAVRSQLHFSQLSAWLARLKDTIQPQQEAEQDPNERRRKLSREKCNIKKLEANCDEKDLPKANADDAKGAERKLNIVYSIKIPGESYKMAEFTRPPTDHTFPITDIGNNVYLKVLLQSLPRRDRIPIVKCCCMAPKRRTSKEMPPLSLHEELALRMNDLTLGPTESRPLGYRCKGASFSPDLGVINSNIGPSSGVSRRLSIFGSTEYIYSRASTPERQLDGEVEKEQPSQAEADLYKCRADKSYLLDDRMHTTCGESGKHKCNCDEESDQGNNRRSSNSFKVEKSPLDERRIKEIAKYKRRLRKETKLRKLRESGTSDSAVSEGDLDTGNVKKEKSNETHTSIPILQASRFDRLRAIGCYRNQTYLTLPASRIESKSPFMPEPLAVSPPVDYRKTISVSTQTDELLCPCGSVVDYKCQNCSRGMVRSEANYDLSSLNQSEMLLKAIAKVQDGEPSGRRRTGESTQAAKKLKCDTICDIISNSVANNCSVNDAPIVSGVRKCPDDEEDANLIKRPKLRKLRLVDRLDKLVTDRFRQTSGKNDMDELLLNNDDSVLTQMSSNDYARRKTSSIGEDDYVSYEKCDYGTFDRCEVDSPTTPNDPVSGEGFRYPEGAVDGDSSCNSSKSGSSEMSSKSESSEKGANQVPSPTEMDSFRWRFDSAASMVFHTKTGLPLTSSPAPLKRGKNCFDYDDSINGISGIKSALFNPVSPPAPVTGSPPPPRRAPAPRRPVPLARHRAGLLGSFEESALKGRLEPVATVHGFTAELGASGAFCPSHKKLPVTVFFYAPGGTNAPYMGHIDLGAGGYRVSRSGTVQVSLFNPHGTLVKMFVVLYDLTAMPASARTFLRQRTLYMPTRAPAARPPRAPPAWLRYLIHLRFLTSKSGKLYLHTDIRIIVSRKSDLDTATAHSAIFKPLSSAILKPSGKPTNHSETAPVLSTNQGQVNRMFGGASDVTRSDFESDDDYSNASRCNSEGQDSAADSQNGVSYELRSFTYGPENPKYSPR